MAGCRSWVIRAILPHFAHVRFPPNRVKNSVRKDFARRGRLSDHRRNSLTNLSASIRGRC
jgi:hypothetical protein